MGRVRIGVSVVVAVLALAPAIAGAQSPGDDAVVVVADVRGPLEQRALDFLTAAVRTSDATLVVLQIDSPGIASGDPTELFEAIAASEVPVTAWVGPPGAEGYGGVAQAVALTAYRGASPGARVGFMEDTMAGGGGPVAVLDDLGRGGPVLVGADPTVVTGASEVTEPIAGLIDEVVPTIGQFIASLDERPLTTASGTVRVGTAETVVAEDGSQVVVPTAEVRFLKPGLLTRTLRLAMRPEATFFFVVAGLALVVFELYAAGVGITAAVAALALFLGGFGVASLPMSWPALAATVAGIVLYTVDFQNAGITWRGLIGTGALGYGGLFLTDASPQFAPRWWAVLLVLVGLIAFYLVALTTVARSRFSTTTIGREHLIGRTGVAETGFDPTGVVVVDGARWRARSSRAAGLVEGDRVEVTSVAGIVLEVAPTAKSAPAEIDG